MPTSGTISSPRIQATGSIASGAAISGDVDLMGYRPAAIMFSSGWDASNKTTFRVSQDATTWYDFFDSSGAEYNLASGVLVSSTSRSVVLYTDLSLALSAYRFMRVQSGPSSAAVNQSTGITFAVQLLPL